MRIILSTGNGRLHLVQSAVNLEKQGVDITLVQGWVPKNPDSWMVRLSAKIIGRHNLADGFKKRRPDSFHGKIVTCTFSEFFIQFLFHLSRKTGFIARNKAALYGWKTFGWQTRKYLKDAQIFHVRSGAGQGGAIEKAKKKEMKVVVDHSAAHPAFMEKALRQEYEEAKKPYMKGPNDCFWELVLKDCENADILLVNSEFVKKTFVNEGYPEKKIYVAYLGVRKDFQGLKNIYSIKDKIKLLFTGNFGILKGAKYILKALQILDKKDILYELNVAGTYEEAKEIINKYPIKGELNLLGHIPQDNLKELLNNADIYIFPSLCEGCASSLMEALAAGLPAVATDESGAPITDNINGCIVPSKNETALSNKIEWLVNNPRERERIGRAAVLLIRENYTWENYARKVVSIYEKCLDIRN